MTVEDVGTGVGESPERDGPAASRSSFRFSVPLRLTGQHLLIADRAK
jgi:hypothetical protein